MKIAQFFRFSFIIAATALGLQGFVAQATGDVLLYENDFENPATTDCLYLDPPVYNNVYGAKNGSFSQDYDTPTYPYIQYGTADRLCVGQRGYVDSTGRAGNYLGGFVALRGRSGSHLESRGLLLPKYEHPFINITIDMVKANLVRHRTNFSQSSTVTASFYVVGSGEQILLGHNSTRGNPGIVTLSGSNTIVSPFYMTGLAIPGNPGGQYELNFTNQKVSVSLDGVDSSMKILVLFTITDGSGYDYVAFDNLIITAANYAITQPMTTYRVEHHIEDARGAFAIQTGDTLIGTGNVGQIITGVALSYTGHTYDSSLSTATGTLLSGEELILSLYYPIDRFTVDFLTYSGSQVDAQTGVAYGSTAIQPTDPTRTGYTFSGWYLSGATDAFDFSTAITGDTTLHARRTIIPIASYTTEHYRQQSDQAYPSTPSVVDTLTGATGSRVTASPKTFAGWTYDPSHTSSITTGTIDATTGLVLKLYYKKDPNVTGPSRPVVGPSKPRLVIEPRPTPPITPSKPIPPTSPVSPTLPKKPTLHPAPSADTVVTTTQDTICSFLKQEDTKVGFDYRYDEINFSDQNTKDSRYTKAIQGLLNHCLVQGIGDDHSTYGIEKNLTIAEARKIFVRLSLISYSEYKSADHRSMRYVSAGDAQNLWQHVLLEYGSTEDSISLGDFMNIASTVIARIKKTTPQIIDNPTLHTRKITRGEAAIVIAHMIESVHESSTGDKR